MLYFIGLGSNLGAREQIINAAIRCLNTMGEMLGVSPFYYSKAKGFESEHDFCNVVIAIRSILKPRDVLKLCLTTERQLGRTTHSITQPDGTRLYFDRPIDIDILKAYDDGKDVVVQTSTLTLPHPRMEERDFVMNPLRALAQRIAMMSNFNFTKLDGLQEDYIVIDCTKDESPLVLLPIITHSATWLCNRYKGIGGCYVAFIFKDKKAMLRIRAFNAQGEEAQATDRLVASVAMLALTNDISDGLTQTIATSKGIRTVVINSALDISVNKKHILNPAIPAFEGTLKYINW